MAKNKYGEVYVLLDEGEPIYASTDFDRVALKREKISDDAKEKIADEDELNDDMATFEAAQEGYYYYKIVPVDITGLSLDDDVPDSRIDLDVYGLIELIKKSKKEDDKEDYYF